MSSALSLRVYDEADGELRDLPLEIEGPGSYELHLAALPGASALHLELSREGAVGHRFEVAAGAGEVVPVHLDWTADGRIGLRSPGREVLELPPDARYAPPPPIRAPRGGGAGLDLVLLVDATTRIWVEATQEQKKRGELGKPRLLLGQPDFWRPRVDLLVSIAEGLAASADLAIGIVAFGDHEIPGVRAPELRPTYVLHPPSAAAARPVPFQPSALRAALESLPATSGGDFVDALAEGLARCADLPWRPGSRRVVLVMGDSPGYSLTSPAPAGANGRVRERTVEAEADRLHRQGVEIATLYQSLPEVSRFAALDVPRRLMEHAAGQYRTLASRPEMAWESGSIDPDGAVRSLLEAPGALARGAMHPVQRRDA